MRTRSQARIGLFPQLLTILFVGLKLTGFIAWSWWWVLSPVLVAVALLTIIYFQESK